MSAAKVNVKKLGRGLRAVMHKVKKAATKSIPSSHRKPKKRRSK